MTSEEKGRTNERVQKLEKLAYAYEKHIVSIKTVRKVTVVIMILLYLIWYGAGVSEYVPATHVFFAAFIMTLYSEDNFEDGSIPSGRDIGLPITGASGSSAFFCTLPFEAKDVLRMRLKRFMANIVFINTIAVINQILFIVKFSGGLFPSGYCTALLLISETAYAATVFAGKRKIKTYICAMILVLSIILSNFAFAPGTDSYNEILPLMNAFDFLSNWAAAAVLIIFPIIIWAAGEIYLKNKNDLSWNLR